MVLLKDFFEKCKAILDLRLVAGKRGRNRKMQTSIERPGLCLTGHFSHFPEGSLLVFGKRELSYIDELSTDILVKQLEQVAPLGIIFGEECLPEKKLLQFCEKNGVCLFLSSKSCEEILRCAFFFVDEFLSPVFSFPGTLVEVFGMGALLQGESSVGKSFSALCLLDRGHRLIADDLVLMKKRHGKDLIGFSPEWGPHHMEIKDIGLIQVAQLLGVAKVKMEQTIDIVLRLEVDKKNAGDKKESFIDLFGVRLPMVTLQASSHWALLIEVVVLNHRLKQMGIHTEKNFSAKLLKEIQHKGLLHEGCATP